MLNFDASALLKNVFCPVCKRSVRNGIGSPFKIFDAHDLSKDCPTKACTPFFNELYTRFAAYEDGQLSLAQLQQWFENFSAENLK